MRFILKILLITLLFFTNTRSQENQVLAKIDNLIITSDEFIARYELTPQLFRENQKIKEELKLEFLYSLVSEKLLSLYGDEIKLDTSLIVKKTLKYFEEMFVRDALYKKVIQEKAQSKSDSLLSYYLSNANNVKMIYIFSDSEKEINDIYALLKMGVPFDSVYFELNAGKADTLKLSVGQMNADIEDKIFTLPDGAVSIPILMEDGWYIFRILERDNPLLLKAKGWESDYKNSKRIAKERAEFLFYNDFMKNFFKEKEVKINAKILRSLSSHIYFVLSKRAIPNQNLKNNSLLVKDIASIESKIGYDSLFVPVVEMKNSVITIGDYLHFLRFENFNVDTLDYHFLFNSLSNKLKNFIGYKMLANEGYRLELQNTKEVKEQVKLWKDNYYMQLVTSMFIDSAAINDDEIIDFYNQRNHKSFGNKEINILEIVTDSLEIVEKVLDEIEKDADFLELAKSYSKNFNGNISVLGSGFLRVNSMGQVGQVAANMKVGDIYGPIKTHEGYLVFKLLGVREDSVFLKTNFAQIKEELGRELSFLKQKNSLNKFIGNLANKYSVDIYLDNLKRILVTSHHSIIYNYIGFGGRVLAVPLLNINMEWVPEWKSNPENIQ